MADATPSASPPHAVVEATDAVGRTRVAKLPLLAIPLVLWLFAWSFWALWGIFVPLMVLAVGRNPRSVWKEMAVYLQYVLRVTAYLSLAVDPFPGYLNRSQPEYPVRLEPSTRRGSRAGSRWPDRVATGCWLAVLGFVAVMAVAAVAQFFNVLVRSRANERVRAFQARQLDLHARTFGFLLSLTDVPPWRQPHRTRLGSAPELP
jgi:hypothetical protein